MTTPPGQEPYSRGGLIGGDPMPVYLVPDDQRDPDRHDQIAHSEGIVHGRCKVEVPAVVYLTGGHRCPEPCECCGREILAGYGPAWRELEHNGMWLVPAEVHTPERCKAARV